MPNFTKKLIDDLQTTGSRIELWDTQSVGLGIRVTNLGRKTWTYRYTYHGTGYRRPVGEYPAVGLPKARELATKMRARVLAGDPPHLDGEPALAMTTFKDLAERFMSRHVMPKLAASTIKSYRWIIKGLLVPAFGPMLVGEIETEHVERFHGELSDKPRTANLAVAVLSKMMAQAERWSYRPRNTNPCDYLDKYRENTRERPLMGDELVRLWRKLDEMDLAGAESIWLTAAIRFTLLTGCRKMEVMNLQWDDVNLEAGTFRLRRHKTVGSVGTMLKALSPEAAELLQLIPRKEGSKFVFPGKRPGCRVALEDGWAKVRDEAGLKDVHFHDLRHTFGMLAGAKAPSLHAVAGAMGHTALKTTQRYAHHVPSTVQNVVDLVGATITELTKKS